MITKKLLLFSAFLLLIAAAGASAQEVSAVTPTAPSAASAPTVAIAQTGGNYLGITATEVTRENMGRYNLREPRGVVVTRVAEGSPAARAGLKTGDVILRFDGEEVTTYRKLQRLISEAGPEQQVRLSISRNGAEQELSVTLGRREDALQALSRVYSTPQGNRATRPLEEMYRNQGVFGFGWGRRIGVSTTELTRQLADYFGVTGGRGLLVTSVAENSPAARAGIKAGDVITDVDGERVENSSDLSRAINRKNEGTVTLRIVRERGQLSLTVTPEKRGSGAISISPELFEIEAGGFEFELPSIEIEFPQIQVIKPMTIKPIVIPRISIPKMKIKPQQLKQLQKLESLMLI